LNDLSLPNYKEYLKDKKMQDLFEVFSGSTVDASFVNHHLEVNGIGTILKNKSDESLLAGWVDPNGIVGTQIFVSADNYEKAEKLVREFLDLREE
jgi:hypothetical protein